MTAGGVENAGAEDLQDRPQEEQPEKYDRHREDRHRKSVAADECPHAGAPNTTTRCGSNATVTVPDAAGGINAIKESVAPSASVTAKRVTGPRYSISPIVPLRVVQRAGAASRAAAKGSLCRLHCRARRRAAASCRQPRPRRCPLPARGLRHSANLSY